MDSWIKSKILLVDDDSFINRLISFYLQQSRIQITTVDNGKAAIQLCKELEYDLVLMNIFMPPGIDGFKTTSEIRGFNNEIPIVAQTTAKYDPEKFFSGGFTDFIFTPLSKENLLKVIRKNLKDKPS
jgi:two-component system, sensor histidine kinase